MSTPDIERPILIVHHDDQPDEHRILPKDDVVVGRDEECDVVLPIRQVSRQHVRIFRQGERFLIQDLESKNGTWVNGQQLTGTRELQNGDEIHLALAVRMQFIGSGATTPMLADQPGAVRGRLRLDREGRRVFVADVEIDPPLSLPQYRLLELLYDHAGTICTRDIVVETVWPEAMGEGVSEQAIDALVRRLRDRLNVIDPERQYIVTVRGHGFRLENPT